jgi:hypothetical protein
MLVTLEKHVPEYESIYKQIGNTPARSRSKSIGIKLEKICERLPAYIEPCLTYSTWRITAGMGCLKFENGLALKSPTLARIMRHATEACCFVATLGGRIDREIEKLMKARKFSEAYLLDAAGSLAIEDAVESFCHDRQTSFQLQGMTTTMRFSPGYCDCPVSEQQALFRLVSADSIGVTLSDTSMMQPRKTISGLFGVVPRRNMPLYSAYSPCKDCSRRTCRSRREEQPGATL